MSNVFAQLRRRLARPERPKCDTCAFVEFFRSNGDGQVTRLHAFCRCPGGPYADHPVPASRRCERWQRAVQRAQAPRVGDPTLTV